MKQNNSHEIYLGIAICMVVFLALTFTSRVSTTTSAALPATVPSDATYPR